MVFRPESILRRLERLREYAADLGAWRTLSLADYVADRHIRYSVERVLHLTTEVILDILDHVLSTKHDVVSDTYEDVLVNARARGIISLRTARQLKGIGGFRNVLAHGYLDTSNEEVYRNLRKMNRILDGEIGRAHV
jgi:uncharacterized protein YutE (UPF0331/DUF86 family)